MEKFSTWLSLLQHVSRRKLFGRVKINGKLVRQTLKTDVFTTARLRLSALLAGW